MPSTVQGMARARDEEVGGEALGCAKAALAFCREIVGAQALQGWEERHRGATASAPTPGPPARSPEARQKLAKARQVGGLSRLALP